MEHYVLYHTELWGNKHTWILAASKPFDKKILIYYLLPVYSLIVLQMYGELTNMLPAGNQAAVPVKLHDLKGEREECFLSCKTLLCNCG